MPQSVDLGEERPPRTPGRGVGRRLGRLVAGGMLVGLLCAIIGLGAFIRDIVQSRAPERATGEGVVVLTGGRDRIDVGLDFLADGLAKRLLISGVHPTTSAEAIRRQTNARPDLFACCVDLGRRAETTTGNAHEAADWVAAHQFHSVVIVTSAYHVPRALLEMRTAFARRGLDIRIQAVGVRKDSLGATALSFDGETLRLLLSEYVKYMLAHGRLLAESSGLSPMRVTGLANPVVSSRLSALN